jgi:hypothetical protein
MRSSAHHFEDYQGEKCESASIASKKPESELVRATLATALPGLIHHQRAQRDDFWVRAATTSSFDDTDAFISHL